MKTISKAEMKKEILAVAVDRSKHPVISRTDFAKDPKLRSIRRASEKMAREYGAGAVVAVAPRSQRLRRTRDLGTDGAEAGVSRLSE